MKNYSYENFAFFISEHFSSNLFIASFVCGLFDFFFNFSMSFVYLSFLYSINDINYKLNKVVLPCRDFEFSNSPKCLKFCPIKSTISSVLNLSLSSIKLSTYLLNFSRSSVNI